MINHSLIPVFKKMSPEQLAEKFNLDFPVSDWVSIEFPYEKINKLNTGIDPDLYETGDNVEFETNRYDVTFVDPNIGTTLSVYVYYDEDVETVIAIDSQVGDTEDVYVHYELSETVIAGIVAALNAAE